MKKLLIILGILVIIGIIIFIFKSIFMIQNDQGAVQEYSNEYYSLQYPNDWEQIRAGWESFDLPEAQMKKLGLVHTIKNPLIIEIFRPKVQQIVSKSSDPYEDNFNRGNSLTIFLLSSKLADVQKEIDQYETEKFFGNRPGNMLTPDPSMVTIDNEAGIKQIYPGNNTEYYFVGKKDGQGVEMSITLVVQLESSSPESKSVTNGIINSIKFTDYYRKDQYIK